MLTLIASLILSGNLYAEAPAKKSRLDKYTSSDEAEAPKDISFSGKVRVVREVSDDVEVFFEGASSGKTGGAYTLPHSAEHYAKYMEHLEKSRKPNGPSVKITADADKRIKSVEISEEPSDDGKGFKIPKDPNEKWDFGNVPD